jgi:hypothetical protein
MGPLVTCALGHNGLLLSPVLASEHAARSTNTPNTHLLQQYAHLEVALPAVCAARPQQQPPRPLLQRHTDSRLALKQHHQRVGQAANANVLLLLLLVGRRRQRCRAPGCLLLLGDGGLLQQ